MIRHGALDGWTGGLRALSPDDVVLRLRAVRPGVDELALLREAQALSDAEVDEAIRAGRDVGVETVLSSDKFKDWVRRARESGMSIGFVTVADAALNTARVAHRVARGGHDVPQERIRARRERAHANAARFAAVCDIGVVFDNSAESPSVLAERPSSREGWRTYHPARLAALGLSLPRLDPTRPRADNGRHDDGPFRANYPLGPLNPGRSPSRPARCGRRRPAAPFPPDPP